MHSHSDLYSNLRRRQDTSKYIQAVVRRPISLTIFQLLNQIREAKAKSMHLELQEDEDIELEDSDDEELQTEDDEDDEDVENDEDEQVEMVSISTQTDGPMVQLWIRELVYSLLLGVLSKEICQCTWSKYIKGSYWRFSLYLLLIFLAILLNFHVVRSIREKWNGITET